MPIYTKNLSIVIILMGLAGCGNTRAPETKALPRNNCHHSAQKLSKIPLGPTGRNRNIYSENWITIKENEKIAEYSYYMGYFIIDEKWIDANGYFEPGSNPEKLDARGMKELEKIKSSFEKLPTITYVYCDGTSDNGGLETGMGRNPPRYNPNNQITLRAKNYYDSGMMFLYFEDENCNPVYKTPNADRGNIILWEVCRPLNPGEQKPSWSVS